MRVAAVKEYRGAIMVRKINRWRAVDGRHIVLFTDFSPSRADPLRREITVTTSATQADDQVETLKSTKFGKGWQAL